MFNPNMPLHLLHGEELGIDIYMFVEAVHRRFGIRPRMVKPSELRMIHDPLGIEKRAKLCCTVTPAAAAAYMYEDATMSSMNRNDSSTTSSDTPSLSSSSSSPAPSPSLPAASALLPPTFFTTPDGELVEEVSQIGLEARQVELLSLDPEILHAVTMRCFNDMRTVFLVHDKRMLGLVKQEVPSLVSRGVLTRKQGKILDRGVADSILPASREMERFTQACRVTEEFKNDFLLKPMRGGKGVGILFGADLSKDEWLAAMRRHTTPGLPLDDSCVIQRRIYPRLYDLILKSTGQMVRFPLVGTYHVVDGRFLGLGTWRSSGDHICAVR